ncbi:pyridine nucleotide-disulfide family oxidoreductase [Enterococcus haemoperoxidus ATCC BAA-382]|uniref:Pyridine nucleotide-disulfide family oxidoreductase n=1 Tax=Enterococcus haemoperoxidus ATCC BAA-382 TaxID=1158608 RepID=R2SXR7_9ENTE|nr:NAD(P)/FAD-dependent oxidoreductase [Enterococcus haemoperoxidus]EOH92814.1 pyridine nucleotide-disulfide family oxidoreductase [Enterococcus haemoperoxidus ATCC BAA-382]EOT61557.1 pyridine nucleotide-disulfide family oxidoreductase [Enterococcus haemoperoxidus ATCC BAA-382]OJG55390.1 pyridine nucleotide-disulfide family oxidoreductase [Enterococcus haemoperoxidus]
MSKHVVILGAGYAGLRALHELQKGNNDLKITLVDQNDYHFEATDIHEVAAGIQTSERITYPIKDVVKSACTTFVQGRVEKIDSENQLVHLKDQEEISYDYLIVALGYESESFGIPGVEEFSLKMVDIPTSEKVYQHLTEQMEAYKETKDENCLKIVVCGAGFTGIELLGSLHEGKKKLAEIAGVDPEKIQLYCVEAVTRLLPMFSEKLGGYGIDHLKKWGVNFLVGKPIKEIKQDTVVYLDNAETNELNELNAKTIIWTTGVSGSHVVGDSGFAAKRGRVMVNPDLTDAGHNNVYIIGDCSAVMDKESNRPYPTTAQISLKMGEHAGKNIKAQLKGEPTKEFTFKSLGSVASIGNSHAFGEVGKMEVKGYPASVIKKVIMDRSLFETGGIKEMLAKGRFDFYR